MSKRKIKSAVSYSEGTRNHNGQIGKKKKGKKPIGKNASIPEKVKQKKILREKIRQENQESQK